MNAFNIMLHQCETQAEKLCKIEIDDKYINEVDIFNNYFNQLKQIIETNDNIQVKNEVDNLLNLLNIFINRIEKKKFELSAKIDSMKKNKNMVGYGTVKHQFAYRINRRY